MRPKSIQLVGNGRRARKPAPARYGSACATDRATCGVPSRRGAEPRASNLPTAIPIGTEMRNHTSRILTITRTPSVRVLLAERIDTLAREVDEEMKKARRVS